MIGHLREFLGQVRRVFPERQIFYRVRGEIDFVTFSARRQIVIFAGLIGLTSWIAFSSMHYLAFDWMLSSRQADAARAWDAYSRADTDRKRVIGQREDLKERLRSLELTLAVLQVSQQRVMERMTERTEGRIDQVLKIIEMTGLDPNGLLEREGRSRADASGGLALDATLTGQGGPFVEAETQAVSEEDPLRVRVAALDDRIGQWDQLENLMGALPLSAPVDYYRLTSTFGRRKDPVNGRWGSHQGVDMANYTGSPVLAPAPGTVVFAGRNGRYGRFIEIDHGYGLRTRYGHLGAMTVKKGEKVQFRQQIGKIGSSGRSTGPHLHYEILVKGKAVDPEKFLNAGRYLFKLQIAEAD